MRVFDPTKQSPWVTPLYPTQIPIGQIYEGFQIPDVGSKSTPQATDSKVDKVKLAYDSFVVVCNVVVG